MKMELLKVIKIDQSLTNQNLKVYSNDQIIITENSNLTITDSLQALNVNSDENMDPNNNLEISLDLIEHIEPNLTSQESIPTAENPASNKKLCQEESTKKSKNSICLIILK